MSQQSRKAKPSDQLELDLPPGADKGPDRCLDAPSGLALGGIRFEQPAVSRAQMRAARGLESRARRGSADARIQAELQASYAGQPAVPPVAFAWERRA